MISIIPGELFFVLFFFKSFFFKLLLFPKLAIENSEKEIQFYFETMTCHSSNNTMDHPKIIVLNQKEESILHKRVQLETIPTRNSNLIAGFQT